MLSRMPLLTNDLAIAIADLPKGVARTALKGPPYSNPPNPMETITSGSELNIPPVGNIVKTSSSSIRDT